MDKCFICHNIRWGKKKEETVVDNLKLYEITIEFPSEGKIIRMNIKECEDCLKFVKELENMPDDEEDAQLDDTIRQTVKVEDDKND